jgi:hypothetical protein
VNHVALIFQCFGQFFLMIVEKLCIGHHNEGYAYPQSSQNGA